MIKSVNFAVSLLDVYCEDSVIKVSKGSTNKLLLKALSNI